MMEEQALDILQRCEITTAVKVRKTGLLPCVHLKMLPELCMLTK